MVLRPASLSGLEPELQLEMPLPVALLPWPLPWRMPAAVPLLGAQPPGSEQLFCHRSLPRPLLLLLGAMAVVPPIAEGC